MTDEINDGENRNPNTLANDVTQQRPKNSSSHTIQQIFDQKLKEDKLGKLQSLLNRAEAYSKFLANRLQEQILTISDTSNKFEAKPLERGFQQPSLVTGGTLKRYQLEGVQWLVSLFENGLNGILADEMGLGKTVQCIAFLAFLREKGVLGPFLVAAPLSTLANWQSEVKRFTPEIPVVMYHGSIEERNSLRKRYLDKLDPRKVSIIITSYEIAMRDTRYLAPIKWKYLIIDEGHRIKNIECRLIKELRTFKTDNRLLITGTPLQNNLTELWSLLNFLLPDIFSNVEDFLEWFDLENNNEVGEEQQRLMIVKLHSILRPLLLRRLKTDVERDLPKKREYMLSANLSKVQSEYYQLILAGRVRELIAKEVRPASLPVSKKRRRISYKEVDHSDGFYSDDGISTDTEGSEVEEDQASVRVLASNTPTTFSAAQGLQNRIMQLRKACNHPFLFKRPTNPDGSFLIDQSIVQSCGKMKLLDQLLTALLARGHKVLIFSQMNRMLDIIADYLEWRNLEYCRIDGSVSQSERQEQIQYFNESSNCSIFILSTRAGGLGINLTSADTVIFYDSDWNPQVDLQAQDRVHRIGQTKPVIIYRLSTNGTAEEKIIKRASDKRKLERLVIHHRKFKGRSQLLSADDQLRAEELLEILKGNSKEIFATNKNRKEQLTLAELEMILDRSDKAFELSNWSSNSVKLI